MPIDHLILDATRLALLIGLALLGTGVLARLSSKLRVPTPVTFLALGVVLQSASATDYAAAVRDIIVPLGTIALAVVLFEGGFNGGWKRTRRAIWPIMSLGVVGTFATTALLALVGHVVLRLEWEAATLVAIALAPTDPAAVFSVLGGQHLKGRAGEVLEGESGVNDPVGIALMLGALELLGGDGDGSLGSIAGTFLLQLTIGAAVGAALGLAGRRLLSRVEFPPAGVHGTVAIAMAMLAVGATPELHGSGFLAAFVAGLVLGDGELIHQRTVGDVLSVGANLGETAMFLALGLSISFAQLAGDLLLGVGLFAALTLVIRPIVTLLMLAPTGFTRQERLFITWGGLRGAVPILLAMFVVLDGAAGADQIYGIVFIAVSLSVIVQGMTLPRLAQRLDLVE